MSRFDDELRKEKIDMMRRKLNEQAAKRKQQSEQTRRPDPPKRGEYTVKKQDTLWDIADTVYDDGTQWKRIAAENNIAEPRRLQIGTKLTVPGVDVVPEDAGRGLFRQKRDAQTQQGPIHENQPVRKLYEAVKSGKLSMDQLNDDGIRELQAYVRSIQPSSTGGSIFDEEHKRMSGEVSKSSGGIFARIQARNEEATLNQNNAAINSDALKKEQLAMRAREPFAPSSLQEEKINMIHNDPKKAPAVKKSSQEVEKERRAAQRDALDPKNQVLKAIKDNTIDAAAGQIDRFLLDSKPGQFISRIGQMGAKMGGVDPTYEATTGSKAGDVAADIVGGIGGVFVNPTGPTSSVAGQASIVGQAYNNPTVQRLAAAASGRIANPLGRRVAEETIREGIAGAVEGGAMALIRGESDPGDVALNALVGGVAGGAIGGAVPVVGAKVGPRIAQAFNSFFSRNRSVAPEAEEATKSLLTVPETPPVSPRSQMQINGKLRFADQDTYINRMMTSIRDEVNQRMTPPLENPDELAKYVRYHLGDDLSLNEVKRLPYEDLVELASEIRKNMSMYDVSRQVAREKGFNLDDILTGKLPNIKERVQLDAQKRVYGIYDAPKVNIARPEGLRSSEAVPVQQAPSLRQNLMNELEEINARNGGRPRGRDLVRANVIQGQLRNLPSEDEVADLPTQGQFLGSTAEERIKSRIRAAKTPEQPVKTPTEEYAETANQDWFTKLFGNYSFGIVPGFRRQGRNSLTTEGQIVDSPLKNTVNGAWETTKAAGRSAYQSHFDMNDPLKRISMEAYEASMDAQRASQLANVIIEDKFVTPEGRVVGEGLQGILHKVGRGNYNAFTDYLILRHAKTRMARGERVYDEKLQMTPEKVQERMNYLESRFPNFKAVGAEWDGFFRNIRNVYGVDSDLMPKALANHLEKQNPNYAPMRRQFTTLERIRGARGNGQKAMFSGQKAPIHEVSPTGSTRKIVDPVRSAMEQTGAWVNASMRNRVMKEIVSKISADPEAMADIAEIVQPPKGQPNLRQILETEGEEGYLEILQEEFNNLFKRGRVDADNVVRAMIKGEPVYVKVKDPEAVKALLGMGSEQASIVLSIANAFSTAIKHGATGALAPMFAVKSVTADAVSAMIQAENPAKHAGYLLGSIFSAIADSTPGLNRIPGLRNMAQDFYRAGGGYSAVLRGERELRKGVGKMRLDPLLHPRTIAKAVGKTALSPYTASIKIADIAENVNRIAAFNYKLRQLGEPTEENVRIAMNYAREITTNYSRRGRKSKGMEAFIPYSNAAMQGLYRTVRAWKKNGVKTAAMVGVGVLLPKAMEYARFHEDKDYQQLPARERYRNLIISKNPDGTFNKLPMPPEYNALGALMVDMLRAYNDGDPDGFKGVSDALVNAYTPPAVSGALQGVTQGGGIEQSGWGLANATSFGALAGAWGNQTFYGGPVEDPKVSDRSPAYRYNERTTAVAKWLGEKMNWSPMKIDYVIRAYGGDPARLILPITSEVGAGRPKEMLLKNFIVDPTFTNTITENFYGGKELLTQANRDHQEVGRPLPAWYSDELRLLTTSTAKGSVTKRVAALRADMTKVRMDKSLTAERKSQKLRDIQAQINEIYIDVNAKMKEVGVPILNR